MSDIDVTFEHEDTFSAAAPTGNVRMGQLESLYEELFADVIADGIITHDERAQLDKMADNLGLDRSRLRRLEEALQAAYEARHHVVIRDLTDEAAPAASLVPLEPATDPRTLALQRRIAQLEARIIDLERDLSEARAQVAVEVDLSDAATPRAGAPAAPDDDPAELARRLRHDPRDDASLHALFRQLTRAGDVDRAFFTAQALEFLGEANADEHAFVARHRREGLLRPQASVTPEAWTRLLFHPEQEPLVGEIFSVVVSAVLMGRLSALRRDKALLKLPTEKKHDPAKTTVLGVRAFAWGAAILGMVSPPLYADPDFDGLVEIVPAVPRDATRAAGALRAEGVGASAFLAGRHLAMQREEHFVRLLFPTIQGLEDIFLAALSIGNPGLPLSAETRQRVVPISKAIEPILETRGIDQLRGHFLRFVEDGGRTNLQRWAASVDKTAARTGLLLAGDLKAAQAVLEIEEPARAKERMDDLLAFAVSERHAKLRKQIGIAVHGGELSGVQRASPFAFRGGSLHARRIEHLPHAPREHGRRDRLLKERDSRLDLPVLERVVGIARHEEHAHVRPHGLESREELGAVQVGHHHVGEDDVDRLRVLLADEERFSAVLGLEHGVPVATEHGARQPANAVLVLDEEDGLRSGEAADLGGRRAVRRRAERGVGLGNEHEERRSFADRAAHRDVTAALLHDPVDGREAQPRALVLRLRGEEGLEDVSLSEGVDALSPCP